MTTQATWIGGGNNEASNPKDWSPNGVPSPGELTVINRPGGSGGTMNIDHINLAGDFPTNIAALVIDGNATLNISDGSKVWAAVAEGHTNINLRGNNTLYLQEGAAASATVDLAGNAQWVGGFGINAGSTLVVDGGIHSSLAMNGGAANFVLGCQWWPCRRQYQHHGKC